LISCLIAFVNFFVDSELFLFGENLLMCVTVVVLISSNHLVLWCFLSRESNINLYWIYGWWVAARYEITSILTGIGPACVDGPIFSLPNSVAYFVSFSYGLSLATPSMTTDKQRRQTFYCENCTSGDLFTNGHTTVILRTPVVRHRYRTICYSRKMAHLRLAYIWA